MTEILLEPGNPLDLRRDKLQHLIEQIQASDESYWVRLAYNDQRGYGVTWWEVLHVWVPWSALSSAAAKRLVELFIDWARRKLSGSDDSKRPRSVTIYGPNGKILKKIQVDSKGEEKVQEPDDDDDDLPRRIHPPVRD